MAKVTVHGKDVRTLFGVVDLTCESMESGWERSVDVAKRPRRGKDRVGYLAGHDDGKYTLSGYIPRAAATGIEAELNGLPEDTTPLLEVFGDSGRCKFANVRVGGLVIGTPAEDKASIKGDFQPAEGVHAGDVLMNDEFGFKNGGEIATPFDLGAAGSNGAYLCMHCPSYNLVEGTATTVVAGTRTNTKFPVASATGIMVGKYIDVSGEVRKVTAKNNVVITVSPALSAVAGVGHPVQLVDQLLVRVEHSDTETGTYTVKTRFSTLEEAGSECKLITGAVKRWLRVVAEASTLASEQVEVVVGFEVL